MTLKTQTQTPDANSGGTRVIDAPTAGAEGGAAASDGDTKPRVAGAVEGEAEDGTGAGEDDEEHEEDASGRRGRKRRLGVDPSLIISDGRSKRRRTPSPGVVKKEDEADPRDAARATALGREIYAKIMESRDADGENMAEPFIKLPSKRQFPDYYELIKHPMSLDTVEAKLNKNEYMTLKEVIADIGQIFNNAKRYNMKDSLLFAYAKKLHKMTRTFHSRITNPEAEHADSDDEAPAPGPGGAPAAGAAGDAGAFVVQGAGASAAAGAPSGASARGSVGRRASSALAPGVPGQSVEPDDEEGGASGSVDGDGKSKRGTYMKNGPTVYKLVKPVLKSIKDARAKDGSGREIAGIFEELPPRKDLPDYYNVIKEPISLGDIEDRMMARKYDTWEEFFADCDRMCANAMEYNEDGSEVFQDAVQIKEILDYNRAEIKARLALPVSQQRQRLKPAATPSRASLPAGTPVAGHSGLPGSYDRPSASPLPQAQGHAQGGYNFASPRASSSTPGGLHAYPPRPPGAYNRTLPLGVVNEQVVAELPRYSGPERDQWVASLSHQALATYRQILAAAEGRRRMGAGQAPLPLGETAAGARQSGSVVATTPLQVFNRAKPPLPAIRYFDITFTSARATLLGDEGESSDVEGSDTGAPVKETVQRIRLRNFRGVNTHAVLVGAHATAVDVTAYVSKEGMSEWSRQPDLGVRVNGLSVTPVLAKSGAGPANGHGDGNGVVNGNGDAAGNGGGGESAATPASGLRGWKWTVNVPKERLESRVEVSSVREGGGYSILHIMRQF